MFILLMYIHSLFNWNNICSFASNHVGVKSLCLAVRLFLLFLLFLLLLLSSSSILLVLLLVRVILHGCFPASCSYSPLSTDSYRRYTRPPTSTPPDLFLSSHPPCPILLLFSLFLRIFLSLRLVPSSSYSSSSSLYSSSFSSPSSSSHPPRTSPLLSIPSPHSVLLV